MTSEFTSPTKKTILDYIEINHNIMDENHILTADKPGDLDDFDTIKDDTDNLVKTILDEVQEKQSDGNSKIEGKCSQELVIEKDQGHSILDFSVGIMKPDSEFTNEIFLNNSQTFGVEMELDDISDQHGKKTEKRNSDKTDGHQMDRAMNTFKSTILDSISENTTRNVIELSKTKGDNAVMTEDGSIFVDTTKSESTFEEKCLSEFIDKTVEDFQTSRSILDVCEGNTELTTNCHAMDTGEIFVQHLEIKRYVNEQTILDHASTSNLHNAEIQPHIETKSHAQNTDISVCSSGNIQNDQKSNQLMSSAVDSGKRMPLAVDYDKPMLSNVDSDKLMPSSVDSDKPMPSNVDSDKPRPSSVDSDKLIPSAVDYDKPMPSAVDSDKPMPLAVDSDKPMSSALDSDKPMVSADDSDQPMETNYSLDCEFIMTDEKIVDEQGQNNDLNDKSRENNKDDVYDIDNDAGDNFTHNPSFRKFRKEQVNVEYVSNTKPGDDFSKGNTMEEKNVQTKLSNVVPSNCKLEEISQRSNEICKVQENLVNNFEEKTKYKVAYIYSRELVDICDQMHKILNRASMVHSLIHGYGTTRYMRIVEPRKATEQEVKMFHDSDYIEFLKKTSTGNQDDTEKLEIDATQYGLSYDCPLHQGLYDYATMTAGATLVAAECLLQETCRVAINWCGGWHHAARDEASGFCYINDIVLGILKLREKYSRILYVDLDLHHGDGVEDAFSATSKVMTVSFHKYASGFFPGTGNLNDIGIGKGQYYTVNVPLQDGIRDAEFTPLVCRILNKVQEKFQPEAVVCQCGADGLAGDPMESFNLTHKGLGKCLYFLLKWNLPTMILGGGGYNFSNTARCWAFLTALAAGKQLPTEIPDHQYFMKYGPDYELEVHPGNRKNHNTVQYLRQVYGCVMNNISKIS